MCRARIVVVGSSNTDMVIKTPRIPLPGETLLGSDFLMAPGGKGANQAVAAARLGGEVTLVARVGSDVFGDRAVANIAAAGVHTEYVVRDEGTPSGIALICVDAGGQNAIVVAPGANACLAPADVEAARAAFAEADVVVVQFETPLETVARTIGMARDLGKKVLVNPAPARALPEGFLQGVDVITPNELEAAMLLGQPFDAEFDGVRAAVALRECGVGAAIVTLGAAGVVAAVPDAVLPVPGWPVEAVDTTAAGDCFTGALAVALGENRDLGSAIAFANAAAALSVTRLGAQPSLPAREEVEALLAR